MSTFDCSENACDNCAFRNECDANESIDKALSRFSADNLPVVYVSGPMSGIAEYNFPQFRAVARFLRFLGYPVVDPSDFGADPKRSWNDCIARDLAILSSVDVVLRLDGWMRSKGARLENRVAEDYGIPALDVDCFDRFVNERFFDDLELHAMTMLFVAREDLAVAYDKNGECVVGGNAEMRSLAALNQFYTEHSPL